MNEYPQPELTRSWAARLLAYLDDLTNKIVRTCFRLDNLSGKNGLTRSPQPCFGHCAYPKSNATLLSFPTGRNFSKKFFVFFPTGRNLAQIYVDNRLLDNVSCGCDEQGTQKSRRTRAEERCEGQSTHPQPSRVQTDAPWKP